MAQIKIKNRYQIELISRKEEKMSGDKRKNDETETQEITANEKKAFFSDFARLSYLVNDSYLAGRKATPEEKQEYMKGLMLLAIYDWTDEFNEYYKVFLSFNHPNKKK